MTLTSAVFPYTVFQNPIVKALLMCLGKLRHITNEKTLELCIQRMGSNSKMHNRVETLDDRFKKVKKTSNKNHNKIFLRNLCG